MPSVRPDLCLPSFAELTPDMVCNALGADEDVALGFDLDGTIIGHHDDRPPDSHLRVLETFGRDKRITGLVSISNAGEDRVDRAEQIVNMAAEAAGRIVHCVTSYGVGHGKPKRPIFRAGTDAVQVPRERTLYIGDQGLKDIGGANWAGYGATALVAPYRVKGERWGTHYLQRPAEVVWRQMIGLPLRTADFDKLPDPVLSGEAAMPEASAEGYRRAKLVSYGGAILLGAGGVAGMLDHEQIAGLYGLLNAGLLTSTGRSMGRRESHQRLDETFESILERYRYEAEESVPPESQTTTVDN